MKFFISHSYEDREWSRRLADSLRQHGMDVFFDEAAVTADSPWTSEVRRQLERSSCVLTVVDPKNVSTPNTFFEAGMAVGLGKPVFFVVPQKEHDLSSDLKLGSYVYRRAPEVTAREIIRSLPEQCVPEFTGIAVGHRSMDPKPADFRKRRVAAKKR